MPVHRVPWIFDETTSPPRTKANNIPLRHDGVSGYHGGHERLSIPSDTLLPVYSGFVRGIKEFVFGENLVITEIRDGILWRDNIALRRSGVPCARDVCIKYDFRAVPGLDKKV